MKRGCTVRELHELQELHGNKAKDALRRHVTMQRCNHVTDDTHAASLPPAYPLH